MKPMYATVQNSLWYKLVGAFAAVTLLTLGVSIAIFFAISQGELARFLTANSASVERIVRQSQIDTLVQSESAITETEDESVVAITVPLENAIQETLANESTELLTKIQRSALGAVGFAAILTLIAGTLLFRQITNPLIRLKNAALALGGGRMKIRVPVTTNDEVGQVGSAFNQMADKLENLENLRRKMIADIAHEIRTPLTVIQSNLEAMIDDLIIPNKQELGEVHQEVLRLIRLTEDLRLLSLADAGKLYIADDQVDIAELIESTLRQMTPTAKARNIFLEGNTEGVLTTINGDSDKLKQSLINLVDNSLRFAPPGGRVVVQAKQTKDSLDIIVADDGPGIPLADQSFVFERFWRGDHSRSRSAGGSGLGLAISKEIVQLHGGSITVNSPTNGGSIFTISLPINL